MTTEKAEYIQITREQAQVMVALGAPGLYYSRNGRYVPLTKHFDFLWFSNTDPELNKERSTFAFWQRIGDNSDEENDTTDCPF